MNNRPILQLNNVSKTFRQRQANPLRAVRDVSFAVQQAEIVALVGESGAGKSTLARLVLGLETVDEGSVVFDESDLGMLSAGQRRRLRQQMHLIFQDPYQSLHPGFRVAQLVAEPLTIAGVVARNRHDRSLAALDEVGLRPAAAFMPRYPHQLSGGQRQRVALARAIIGRPKLIIADEPTSMLDVSLQAEILTLLATMRTHYGAAFLLITHNLDVAQQVADRIVVMRSGQVVESGRVAAVINQPQHSYTKMLIAASKGDILKEFYNE